MTWMMTKYLITGGLVVLISEVAKRSYKISALIAALPLVTVLTLFWLYFKKQGPEKMRFSALRKYESSLLCRKSGQQERITYLRLRSPLAFEIPVESLSTTS
jgi:hypothetical protein